MGKKRLPKVTTPEPGVTRTDTGIYLRERVSLNEAAPDRARAAFLALASDELPYVDWLREVAEELREVAADESNPEAARDARHALYRIDGVLRMLDAIDHPKAAMMAEWAHDLGVTLERLRVRDFEPHVAAERARREAAADSARQLNECYAELHGEYQPAVDSLVGEGLSYTKATEQVAAKHGVSPRTVQRRTTNKHPRHKSRHHPRGDATA